MPLGIDIGDCKTMMEDYESSMSPPLVSVIIPVFNAAEYIRRSVASVFNQTYPNMQVVLVEDCSSDNSVNVCAALAKDNSRIIYIRHSENKGQTITRNDGLANATGDWVMFLDADDVLEKDAVRDMLDGVEDDTDIIFANYRTTQGSEVNEYAANIKEGVYNTKQFVNHLFDDIPASVLTCIGSKIYRKDFLDHRKRYTSDLIKTNYDMAFIIDALIACNKIKYINKVVYNYIQREDSITYSYRKDMYKRISEARARIPELLDVCECYESKIMQFQEMQLQLIVATLNQEIKFNKGYRSFKLCVASVAETSEFSDIQEVMLKTDKSIKSRLYVFAVKKECCTILYAYHMIKTLYRKIRERVSAS